jgi:hypothetical protein
VLAGQEHRATRSKRRGRFVALLVVVMGALTALVASIAAADTGSNDVDQYTMTVSPGHVTGGGATTFTLSLINNPNNAEADNGATLIAPHGFQLVSASLLPGESGNAQVSGNEVQLGGLVAKPGQRLWVKVTAKTPSRCGTDSYKWGSAVWEDDNDFPGGHEPQTLIAGGSHITTRVVTPCLRRYALVVSPGRVAGGATTHLKLALHNGSSRRIDLGSANLTAPTGFHLTHASFSSRSEGTATVSGRVVRLRNLQLQPGATVDVKVTAATPARCGSASYGWTSAARTGEQFGQQALRLVGSGSGRTTSVRTTCTLEFLTQPHNAIVGEPIRGIDNDASGPPVEVGVVDGSGNVVTSADVAISVALGKNPAAASLSGTTTKQAVGGVASFGNLVLNQEGYNYTLVGSTPSVGNENSSEFNDYSFGSAAICKPHVTCTGAADSTVVAGAESSQQLQDTAFADPNGGVLATALDVGVGYWTSSAVSADCDSYQGLGNSYDIFQMTDNERFKQLTDTITTSVPNLAALDELITDQQYCLAAPYKFQSETSAGSTTTQTAARGALPGGSPGYIGLLPDCPTSGSISSPCVGSRGGGLISALFGTVSITIDIPAGEAEDPFGRH